MPELFLLPDDMDFTVTVKADNAALDLAFIGSTHRSILAKPIVPPGFRAIHMPAPHIMLIKFRDGRWVSRSTQIELVDGQLQTVVAYKGN